MPQKDYILRVAEDVDRALAQIIYHQDKLEAYELPPNTSRRLLQLSLCAFVK